ncbi:MAG: hypothetical protein ACFCUE_09085 [Candidatus Bathyarchaeia archaeon]
MDKLALLKYAAVFLLILFVSFIGLGLVLNVNVFISLGLVLFAVGSGLLTYYLVTTKA